MAIGFGGPLDGLEFAEGLSETTPPFLANQAPAPGATSINPSTNVEFTLDDLDSGVLLSSVIVSIDDGGGFDVAYSSETFQAGYAGSVTPNGIGFDFLINPNVDFPASQLVQVRVQGTDVDGNALDTTYSFTTSVSLVVRLVDAISHGGIGAPPIAETNPPFLQNQVPAPGATGVLLNSNIAFRVTDAADDVNSGVDISTLVITVQVGAGPVVTAYSAFLGGFQPGFAGSVTDVFADQMSYDIVINPDVIAWPGLTVITVDVSVRDLQPLVVNLLDTSYTFTTVAAEVSPPFLSDEDPAPASGPAGNQQDTNILFRVNDTATDPDSGVDIDTLHVEIKRGALEPFEDAIIGGVFQPGFSGSITDLGGGLVYEIDIDPASNLFDADTTSVRVNVDDTKTPPNHLNTTYSFQIEQADQDAPFVNNRSPEQNETGVAGDTDIQFHLNDLEAGVDLSTVDVTISIDGTPSPAVIGGTFQPGWLGSSIVPLGGGSYSFILVPDLPIGTSHTITVTIDAQDLALTPNVMPQESYQFSTSFLQPKCTLAECRIVSLLGSIIQLDGRQSKSDDGSPITFQWKFIQVPVGSVFEADLNVVNPASLKDLRPSTYSAVSFIPDKLGDYLVELKVFNGLVASEGCTALVEIGLSRALCGAGKVPDASFLWSFISNFWALVEDRQYFPVIWSGQMQLIGAELIKLWSNDYNKSLDTIQNTVQRRWQRVVLHTELGDKHQRVIVGHTKDGVNGFTGEIGSPGAGDTNIFYTTLANEDFTTIDVNYGAKGRVIDINGEFFTIERVYNTEVLGTDYSVVIIDEEAVNDGQSNIPYRIPHMIHVPLTDLEEMGVRVGDTLVLEWTRGDTGLTAEMNVRVAAIDRERIGFEFTIAELDPGDPTLDYGLFEQLVKDLKIVPPTAIDVEIAAAANALIAFIPTGINLSTRPFSVFQITVKAGKVIHNTARRIDDFFVSIPHLQEEVRDDPPVILRENFDYVLEDGYLIFLGGLFSTTEPAPEELWAECVHIDNTPTIEANFGNLVELKSDDLVSKATRAPYLAAIKGLWFALTNGPTLANVRLGLQILMGLPFSETRGKILDITNNFSTDIFSNPIGRILAEDVDEEGRSLGVRRFYFFPEAVGLENNPLTGEPFKVGEIIEAFLPLSKGVEVTDYVKNPRWWVQNLAGAEIKKFFLFKAQIDTESGVFDENDLVFSLEFIRKIKPVYTNVIATVLRSLEDDILEDFEDEFVDSKHILRFYDNVGAFGAHESTVRSNDYNHQGVILWRGDSRPFSTRSLHTIRDLVTSQNGSDVEADSASGLGPVRARVAGDSSNPFIEGDLVVIHPGQPGAGALTAKMYEITSVTLPNGPAVLGNEAPAFEPTDLALTPPVAASFSYGSDLIASIVRRAVNPVVRGANLETIAGALQLGQAVGALFKTNGVEIDDHLVIEAGANKGEYRIKSIVAQTSPRDYTPAGVPQISETQVGLVTFAGANPALANLTNQVFRIIRPSMMRTRVENARIIQSAGNMHATVLDAGTSFPFDVFTPGMVGQELLVQNAENPLNNGTYTILEYIHAGNVRITTGLPQTTDAVAQAVVTIRSTYHPGFERAEELAPTEVLDVDVEGFAALVFGSSSVFGTLTGIGNMVALAAGTTTLSASALGAMIGTITGSSAMTGTLIGFGAMVGSIAGVGALTATAIILSSLAAGSSTLTATPVNPTASIAGTSTVSGTLTGVGSMSGSSAGTTTVSGTLTAA